MFVQPMLAVSTKLHELKKRNWQNYIMEPKHDGMRAIIVKNYEGVVTVYGRSGKVYTQHVPHIVAEMIKYLPNNTIIDGELAIVSDTLQLDYDIPIVDFNKTMRVMGSLPGRATDLQTMHNNYIKFIAWDLVRYAGEDLSPFLWSYRRTMLELLYKKSNKLFILNPYWEVDSVSDRNWLIEDRFNYMVERRIEGLILKNKNSLYLPGGRRANTWYKLKAEKTFDVVIMGYTQGTGKYSNMVGALEFGAYDNCGQLTYVGKCSGMTDLERESWTKYFEQNIHDSIVIEIKSNDMVGSGRFKTPRHPQYLGIRTDKKPFDCKLEQFLSE